MKICIHRGLKEIGGSCVEIESQGKRLILDMGLPLDTREDYEKYIPPVKGLDGNDPSLLGVLISHPHLDHYGLLPYISEELPVGMGPAARRILEAASPFMRAPTLLPKKGWEYKSGEEFSIPPFKITPYLVDHSAYDAYAFLIESGGRRIFYSGDFRAHGRKAELFYRFIKKPPQNIDLLLMEGTTLSREENYHRFPKESEVEEKLRETFNKTEGLAMVHSSAQNIDRVVSIYRAAKASKRRLLIDLYAASVFGATGNENIPQSFWPDISLLIPHPQRVKIKNDSLFKQLREHSVNRIYFEDVKKEPEKYLILFRPLYIGDLTRHGLLNKAVYIYSHWEGYWHRGDFEEVRSWIEENNIPKYDIHTSGHASKEALIKLAEALKPEKIIPIHTLAPDMYKELFEGVVSLEENEWVEV